MFIIVFCIGKFDLFIYYNHGGFNIFSWVEYVVIFDSKQKLVNHTIETQLVNHTSETQLKMNTMTKYYSLKW